MKPEETWIASMPKIELHCHLDGSIPVKTIRKLAAQQGVPVPESEAELKKALSVSDDCRSLKEYLEKFDLVLDCLQTAEALREAAVDFVASVAAEQVRYAEARFAPLLSAHDDLSALDVVKSVLDGFKQGEVRYGVKTNAILCAMRHESEETNAPLLDIAKAFLGQGVCAVDLAGDEAAFSVLNFKGFFEEARRLAIPYTIHAGECGSAQSIRDALSLGAQRIGHGIAMAQDNALQALCAEKGIGIEMCPISNMQTKAAKNWETYPFLTFFEKGLRVTVNTDNRTVSNTSLTREFAALRDHYDLSKADILQLTENALQVAFLSDAEKDDVRQRMSVT